MRRLWAYIVIAFTAIVMMGTSFSSIFLKSNSNYEYSQGREMVFAISEKDENAPIHKDGDPSMASVIAKEMETRLNNSDINSYEVTILGEDSVKVTTYQTTEARYLYLANYLSFNGSLALTTSKAKGTAVAWTKDGSNFISGNAYRTEISDINPAIVIPVNQEDTAFKEVLKEAQEAYDEAQAASSGEEGESEEAKATLYFWHDYETGDSYESLSQQQEVLGSKLVMTLTYEPDDSEGNGSKNLYLDGNKNLMFAMINQDMDGSGDVTSNELKEAYWMADYYIRLINAPELAYKVEYKYFNDVSASVETLVGIANSDYLTMSATMIATICAIVIISLLLVVFFRLGAVAAITASLGSVFTAVGLIVAFGAEFNTAAVVGLILVGIASLVSNVIYLTKLKDEAYKGRTLKKANTEAGKKAVLPIVDVNVVIIVIGAMTFLMGGSILRTFSVACVMGGLASLIINLVLFRLMMWLATNTTKLTGKYGVFGIEADKVPDHSNEEKQKYFGAYADKDFTKKRKPFGIITAILFVATLAGSITFSVLNNGDLFRTSSSTRNTEVVLAVKDQSEVASDEKLGKILSQIHYYSDANATSEARKAAPTLVTYENNVLGGGTFNSPTDSIVSYVKDVKENKYDEVVTYVYVVTLPSSFNEKLYACYVDATNPEFTVGMSDALTVNELFEEYLKDARCPINAGEPTMKLRSAEVIYSSTPKSGTYPKAKMILIATLIGCAILAVYFMLRYRLTRGIASLIIPLVTSMITVGIFSLVRVIASSYIVVAIPLVAAFTFMLSIIFMNKEREMVIDDKTHDKSYANREKIMIKANSMSFTAVLYSAILALYLVINFFGFGPSSTSMIYIVAIVGCLLATLIVTTLFGPLAQLFYKWFSNIHVKPRKPRKNKANKHVNKSAEPEEAIFIGIND